MTLRVLVQTDGASEEMRHPLLLGDRKVAVRQWSRSLGSLVWPIYGPKGLSHQFHANKVRWESSGISDSDLHLAKGLKNSGIVFAAQECGIYPRSDQCVELAARQETGFSIPVEIRPGLQLLCTPGKETRLTSARHDLTYEKALVLQPTPRLE
jgi:hypothetical protein